MRRLRSAPAALALAVALGVLGAGCKRAPRHPVGKVEVQGGTVEDNGQLGLGPQEVAAELRRALEKSGHFELLGPGARRDAEPPASSLSLELLFTREAQRQGRDGTWAEVGATLRIRRRVGLERHHYEVFGLGEELVTAPEDRARAVRAAFDAAVAQVVASAHLQLLALGKEDPALLADLKAEDPRVQEFALRVLTERRNPAVAQALIDRLKTTDEPDQLRRLIGALAELREQRAVQPLIELTRGKDPLFLREVVFALAQIGGEEAMAYLFTVAQGHDDPVLRQAAQTALAEVEQRVITRPHSKEAP